MYFELGFLLFCEMFHYIFSTRTNETYNSDSNMMSSYILERILPKDMKIILFTETAKFLNTYASLLFSSLAKSFLKGFSTKDRKWNPKSSYTAPQSKGLICRNLGY